MAAAAIIKAAEEKDSGNSLHRDRQECSEKGSDNLQASARYRSPAPSGTTHVRQSRVREFEEMACTVWGFRV